jgi:hypothetical protein
MTVLAFGSPPKSAIYEPPPANQFASVTEKYLYVVWALPKDLAPLRDLSPAARVERVFKTAVYMCAAHKKKAPGRDCKVHLLRLDSNDEYSTAMANAYVTLGKLVLPGAVDAEQLLARVEKLSTEDLKKQFARVELDEKKLEP